MDYAQPGPLKHTCLCFYVGEITPPQELSCACFAVGTFLIKLSVMIYSPLFLSRAEEVPRRCHHCYFIIRHRCAENIKKSLSVIVHKTKDMLTKKIK